MKKFAIGNMVRVTNKVYGDGKKYDGDLDYDMGIDYTSYYFVPRLAGKQGKIIDIKNGVYKLDFAG